MYLLKTSHHKVKEDEENNKKKKEFWNIRWHIQWHSGGGRIMNKTSLL